MYVKPSSTALQLLLIVDVKTANPVIFVAHSLGGIILQSGLQHCKESLRRRAHGIIFLGVPYVGALQEDWTSFMEMLDADAGRTRSRNKSEDTALLNLQSINISFENWLGKQTWAQRVFCFYEVSPMPGPEIVS